MVKKGETTERQFKQIIQRVTQTLKELNIQQVVNNLTDVEIKDRDLFWNVRFTVEPSNIAFYQFDEFKSKKQRLSHFKKSFLIPMIHKLSKPSQKHKPLQMV